MADELLTIDEAAALLRVHPTSVRRLIKRGEIRAIRIGRVWRVNLTPLLNADTPAKRGEVPEVPTRFRTRSVASQAPQPRRRLLDLVQRPTPENQPTRTRARS